MSEQLITCPFCGKKPEPFINSKVGFYAEIQGAKMYLQHTRQDGSCNYDFLDMNFCPSCGDALTKEAIRDSMKKCVVCDMPLSETLYCSKHWDGNTRNKPLTEPKVLTLEELKQMRDEPVYVKFLNDDPCFDSMYGIVKRSLMRNWFVVFDINELIDLEELAIRRAVAYTHKPKEAKTNA